MSTDFMMEDFEFDADEADKYDWTQKGESETEGESDNPDEEKADEQEYDAHMETLSVDWDGQENEYSVLNHTAEAPAESDHVAAHAENDTAKEHVSNKQNYSPSFTGLGKCKCGCGSFVGCGSICEACGHSYKAHGPY